jgi:hypothetical protein
VCVWFPVRRDRYGHSPMEDAIRHGHVNVQVNPFLPLCKGGGVPIHKKSWAIPLLWTRHHVSSKPFDHH